MVTISTGMGWDGLEWKEVGCDGTGLKGMGWDEIGWDEVKWDGMGEEEMGWKGMGGVRMSWDVFGWDRMRYVEISYISTLWYWFMGVLFNLRSWFPNWISCEMWNLTPKSSSSLIWIHVWLQASVSGTPNISFSQCNAHSVGISSLFCTNFQSAWLVDLGRWAFSRKWWRGAGIRVWKAKWRWDARAVLAELGKDLDCR